MYGYQMTDDGNRPDDIHLALAGLLLASLGVLWFLRNGHRSL